MWKMKVERFLEVLRNMNRLGVDMKRGAGWALTDSQENKNMV